MPLSPEHLETITDAVATLRMAGYTRDAEKLEALIPPPPIHTALDAIRVLEDPRSPVAQRAAHEFVLDLEQDLTTARADLERLQREVQEARASEQRLRSEVAALRQARVDLQA